MNLFQRSKSPQPRRRTGQQPASQSENLEARENYIFRRNRTLTGSVSSRVATINETGADMKSARVQAHELTYKRRHIGALLFGVFSIALFLFALISQFTAGVSVRANGIASLDNSYEEAIQSYYAAHPIERLRFLLNTNQLTQFLQSKTPEIASVKDITWKGFGASAVTVAMREPIAGWTIQNKQQYVDLNGVAFSRNYYSTPSVQIIDNSGAQPQTGQTVASNRFLGFVGRTAGLAAAQNITVTQVTIPAGTTREVELRVNEFNAPIKLTIDRPAGEQIEDMTKAVRWFKAQNKTPEYVDVRVSGRAFYK